MNKTRTKGQSEELLNSGVCSNFKIVLFMQAFYLCSTTDV